MLNFLFTLTFDYKFSDPAFLYAYINLGFHHYAVWFITCIVFFVYYCLINIISDYTWSTGLKKVGFLREFSYLLLDLVISISDMLIKFLPNFLNMIYIVLSYISVFFFNGLIVRVFNIVYNKYIVVTNIFLNVLSNFRVYPYILFIFKLAKDNLVIAYSNLVSVSYNKLTNILVNLVKYFNGKPVLPFYFFNRFFSDYSFAISKGYLPVKNLFLFISDYSVFKNKFFRHNLSFELIVAIVPILIVYFLVVPSLAILYQSANEELCESFVEIMANQWYWIYSKSYQYLTEAAHFSSYMSPDYAWQVGLGAPRLLNVDNMLVLPSGLNIKLIVTSADVLHAFTLPSLSVKVDAVPGRLTEVMVNIYDEGIYFGQCSELCGVEHGFMPIQVFATSPAKFISLNNFSTLGNNNYKDLFLNIISL